MKAVNADYIIDALNHFNDRVNGDEHFLNGIETAKEIIENAPTAYVIPVDWLFEKAAETEKNGDQQSLACAYYVRQLTHKYFKEFGNDPNAV